MNYLDYFKKELALVESYLAQELPASTKCPPTIHEALRYAAVSVVGFYLVASLLMMFAIKRLQNDWVEESPTSS